MDQMDIWTEEDTRGSDALFSNPFIQKFNNPLLGLVVPRGNAPRSSGYQPDALLLSYGTVLICGFEPKRTGRNAKFSFAGRIRMTRFGL